MTGAWAVACPLGRAAIESSSCETSAGGGDSGTTLDAIDVSPTAPGFRLTRRLARRAVAFALLATERSAAGEPDA